MNELEKINVTAKLYLLKGRHHGKEVVNNQLFMVQELISLLIDLSRVNNLYSAWHDTEGGRGG